MSTLLQGADGDIVITNGKLTLVQDRAQCVAMKLRNRFMLFQGDWFLDTRIGVPYFQRIFGKVPGNDLRPFQQLFRQIVLTTPSVTEILSDSIELDSERLLTYTFRCITDERAIIAGGTGEPFIVETP